MTFYNIIAAVLFLGAFQQVLLAVDSMSWPRILMAGTLALLVFSDAVFTSHIIEGTELAKYDLNLMVIDLVNFVILAMAIVVISPMKNVFDIEMKGLAEQPHEAWFWALLGTYWLLAMLWAKLAKWYEHDYPRKLNYVALGAAGLFFLQAVFAMGGEGPLAIAGRWAASLYMWTYILFLRPFFLSPWKKKLARKRA